MARRVRFAMRHGKRGKVLFIPRLVRRYQRTLDLAGSGICTLRSADRTRPRVAILMVVILMSRLVERQLDLAVFDRVLAVTYTITRPAAQRMRVRLMVGIGDQVPRRLRLVIGILAAVPPILRLLFRRIFVIFAGQSHFLRLPFSTCYKKVYGEQGK